MSDVITGYCYDCGEYKETDQLRQIPNNGDLEFICQSCLEGCEHRHKTRKPNGDKMCSHCGTVFKETTGQTKLGGFEA